MQECSRLSGPDRVDNLTLAGVLLKMPQDSEHMTVTLNSPDALDWESRNMDWA